MAKTEYKGKRIELPVDFTYEILDFHSGLERLILILRQRTKMALTKENLLLSISPEKSEFVRKSIMQIYEIVEDMNSLESQLSRSKTMYNEWDLVFGKLYGNESEETDFTSVSPSIRKLYGISEDKDVNAKYYLFSLQTFLTFF